jgi:5-methylcytosine-specific restriction endonuclease McrA
VHIRERDGKCVRCGATEKLQCCHVLSRRYRLTRWDPDNAVTMCQADHVWQTHHPLEGDEFFESIGIDLHALRMRALGKTA